MVRADWLMQASERLARVVMRGSGVMRPPGQEDEGVSASGSTR